MDRSLHTQCIWEQPLFAVLISNNLGTLMMLLQIWTCYPSFPSLLRSCLICDMYDAILLLMVFKILLIVTLRLTRICCKLCIFYHSLNWQFWKLLNKLPYLWYNWGKAMQILVNITSSFFSCPKYTSSWPFIMTLSFILHAQLVVKQNIIGFNWA